jgi:hypothetical protein
MGCTGSLAFGDLAMAGVAVSRATRNMIVPAAPRIRTDIRITS